MRQVARVRATATGIMGENVARGAAFSPHFCAAIEAAMQRIVKRVDKRTILL